MKDEIQIRFDANLARVQSLIDVYDTTVATRSDGAGAQGRVSVATADLLRAAVVFLHATLEDLLRSALDWQLPVAKNPQVLAQVPLVGTKGGREPRHGLSDLAHHRGKTVEAVIQESVTDFLEKSNFNNLPEIIAVLGQLALDQKLIDPYRSDLASMMSRRHWIVHRADRNMLQGRGHYAAQSLPPATVKTWRDAVRGFSAAILAALP